LRRGDETRYSANGKISGGGLRRDYYRGYGPTINNMVAGARWLLIVNPVVNRIPLFKHG
jgi:hypothetical protein